MTEYPVDSKMRDLSALGWAFEHTANWTMDEIDHVLANRIRNESQLPPLSPDRGPKIDHAAKPRQHGHAPRVEAPPTQPRDDGPKIEEVFRYEPSGDAPQPTGDNSNGPRSSKQDDSTTTKVAFEPTPFKWRKPKEIERRPWLYAKHYIREFVSSTIGRRGGGKTTHGIAEILSMVTGKDLLKVGVDNMPKAPLRVWYIGEDPHKEIERRVVAGCDHYGVTEEDIAGRLFFDSVYDLPREARKVAFLKNGAVVRNQLAIDALNAGITKRQIDVLELDPVKKFHGVRESDNDQMDEVMVILQEIATAKRIAVEVKQHTRKPSTGSNNAPMTADDGRGADAITAAVRSARVINAMSAKDAKALGVPVAEAWRYFRIDDTLGKANMKPPGKAVWSQLTSVILPCGESVGVLQFWKPENAFDGITSDDMRTAARLAATGDFRSDIRSPDWFGYTLAKELGIPVTHGGENKEPDLHKIKTLINTWVKNKALQVEERTIDGHKRKFIVPGKADEPEQDDDDE